MKQKDNKSSEARLESKCDHPNDDIENFEEDRHIPEHTKQELTAAIDCLKKKGNRRTAGESKQNVSKDLTKKTITMIHELFNF